VNCHGADSMSPLNEVPFVSITVENRRLHSLTRLGASLRHVGGCTRIANSTRRSLVIQADLLLVEDANEIAFNFEKLVWVLFYLCQSTKLLKFISSLMVHRNLPPQSESSVTPAPAGNRLGAEHLAWAGRGLSTVSFCRRQ
jgi:hypothetical protein